MSGLYLKLAAVGIGKNGRHYTPYIITSAIMVSVLYIITFLSYNPLLSNMTGGRTMGMILTFGTIVMAIFSMIFLFYTNSFLIKSRKKEFGLYNILGLKKSQIAKVLIWENLIIYTITMIGGLALGILFSKLAELLAVRMLHGDINYKFSVDPISVIVSLIVFAVIFTLILINSLRQLFFSRPIELLRSNTTGEKPPKTNVPFAVLGVILLGTAYYMAISIEQPSAALAAFMFAVILVILATYLLFIAGSVALCAILKKNKNYYYKTEHFVSVSQMAYRMRKNGAGLASICILSTMVLVTLSSTATLYMGVNKTVEREHPTDFEINFHCLTGNGTLEEQDTAFRECCEALGITPVDITDEVRSELPRKSGFETFETNENIDVDIFAADVFPEEVVSGLNLAEDEFAYYEPFSDLINNRETITFKGYGEIKLRKIEKLSDSFTEELKRYTANGFQPDPRILLFCKNRAVLEKFISEQDAEYNTSMSVHHRIGFNVTEKLTGAKSDKIESDLDTALRKYQLSGGYYVSTKFEVAGDVYGIYGGLFFLGILLGGVFMLSAVLIMYYKQITEGFEDAARFEILRKVGMTKSEIKRSINSQVVTVFFLPLLAAGVHMAFAFPILARMLTMFNMRETGLFALMVLGVYLIFAAVYVLVYKATSKSYSAIVNK